jgi:anti-sigma regulatory factor (Ser/Thr protein kinase)
MIMRVQDVSEVGAARRSAVSFSEDLGFPEEAGARIALAVTELATNLVRHGGGGELILHALPEGGPGLEILAVDKGAGIADVPRALRDGFSTAGSNGTGLGAVSRQGDHFELFSLRGAGTVVLVRFLRSEGRPDRSAVLVRGVCVPHPAEQVGGDAWAASANGVSSIMVVDGLGHGTAAAEAATLAVTVFEKRRGAPATEVLEATHAALRATRGAAVGIAQLRPDQGVLAFVGVGNIAGVILTGTSARHVVSHAGIVGHQCRKIQEFTYPWSPEFTLVLHSDGLQSHWNLDRYPGLSARDPAIVAATLYRDHSRGRDDVTVVVAREARPA